MTIPFEKLCEACTKEWLHTEGDIAFTPYVVNDKNRVDNEMQISQLFKLMKNYQDRKLVKDEMQEIMLGWMRQDDILKMKYLNADLQQDFLKATRQFVKDAKAFDKEISQEDIAQAMRNVWIFLMLGLLLGKGIQYHKAIFAYSMLYPYTDNYLDNENISKEQKHNFNRRLRSRLQNVPYINPDDTEQKMDALIGMIEAKFSRDIHADVYESLLCIQKGQEHSVKQQHQDTQDLLRISVMKGGASVLADGFLIDGSLTYDEQLFCMRYGFFLQLADDLQDMKEDRENGHDTLLSTMIGTGDAIISKLIKFTSNTMDHSILKNKTYAFIVEYDCILLMLMAILQNKERFTRAYLKKVMRCMPVSKSFMETFKDNMKEVNPEMDLKSIAASLMAA